MQHAFSSLSLADAKEELKKRKAASKWVKAQAVKRRKHKNDVLCKKGELNLQEIKQLLLEDNDRRREIFWIIAEAASMARCDSTPEGYSLCGARGALELDLDAAQRELEAFELANINDNGYGAVVDTLLEHREKLELPNVAAGQLEALRASLVTIVKDSKHPRCDEHNLVAAAKRMQDASALAASVASSASPVKADLKCRAVHLLCEPECAHLAQRLAGRVRLDTRDQDRSDIWNGDRSFTAYFNNPDWKPSHVDPSAPDLSLWDPSACPDVPFPSSTLRSLVAECRNDFKTAYSRWCASGQNDPDSFSDFTGRQSYLLYWFFALKDSPALQIAVDLSPERASADFAGLPGGPPKRRRNGRNPGVQASSILADACQNPESETARKRDRKIQDAEIEQLDAQRDYFTTEAAKSKVETIETTQRAIAAGIKNLEGSDNQEDLEVVHAARLKARRLLVDLIKDD